MKLLFATRSAGKKREIRRILEAAGHEVVFPDDVGVPERPIEDTLEVADSFETNARHRSGARKDELRSRFVKPV